MVGIILSAFCPYLVHVDDCVCERERGGNAPQYTATHTTTHCNTEVCVGCVMVEIIWSAFYLIHVDICVCVWEREVAIHRNTLQHTLQRIATHCNTLEHTATHCDTLQQGERVQRLVRHSICVQVRYNTLQHTATHCNTLQHTATHCNTLQHRERLVRRSIFASSSLRTNH